MTEEIIMIRRFTVCALMLVSLAACVWARDDMYSTLATELCSVSDAIPNPKIAIIPFTYVDKRQSSAGIVISERLTTRIVKLKKCTVVERQMLENVMQELHLEATGVIDAAHTKEIGKMLGVDAIVSGSLMDISDNRVEVNARVVKTETAEVVATSSVDLDKDWDNSSAQSQPQEQQAQYQPMAKRAAAQEEQQEQYVAPVQYRRPPPVDGFFDIFTGNGSGTMDLKFANSSHPISETSIGIDFNGDKFLSNTITRTSVSFPGAKTAAGNPALIGFRVGGYGRYFGGDIEMSYYTQHITAQTASTFSFSKDDYFTVGVFNLLTGDICLRYPFKYIQPYIGMGIGMTLNSITSPYIYSYDTSGSYSLGLNDMAIGFTYRFPIGVRVMLGDFGCLFLEYRPTTNLFTFDRGISSETDTVTMSTNLTVFGYSARFGTPIGVK